MTAEASALTPTSPNFNEVANAVSKLVPPNTVNSTDEHGWEIEFPGWDGSVRGLDLEATVSAEVGLGNTVHARVIGDAETGIAVILRSRNLFETRRFGFWVQPTAQTDNPGGFEVWQAPAQKPKRGIVYWGHELLDRGQATQSSPEVVQGLIASLQNKQ